MKYLRFIFILPLVYTVLLNQVCLGSWEDTVLKESISRRLRTSEIDLTDLLPSTQGEGFLPFLDWIKAFDKLPQDKSYDLVLAFTLNGEIIRKVQFRVPKIEFLKSSNYEEQRKKLVDYVSGLVLFGQAFVGGDGIVSNWESELAQAVEKEFKSGQYNPDAKGHEKFTGMLKYLEQVYGRPYEFKIASTAEIDRLEKIEQPSYLLEVDKAIIDMNEAAETFKATGNAGPYGLPGVIEQYLNQSGVYNKFLKLIKDKPEIEKELRKLNLMPGTLPYGDKGVKRRLLLDVQDMIRTKEELDEEKKEIDEKLKSSMLDPEERQKLKDRKARIESIEEINPQTKEKLEGIFYAMGKELATTLLIAKKFMDFKNVVIVGQATEGVSGALIKKTALDEIAKEDLPEEDKFELFLPADTKGRQEGKIKEFREANKEEDTENPYKKFDDLLAAFGQAIAMAAKASENLYPDEENNHVKGKVIGVDIGSSDFKTVYVENGKVRFTKKFNWPFSGKITKDSPFKHKDYVIRIMDLARLKVGIEDYLAKNEDPSLRRIYNQILNAQKEKEEMVINEDDRDFRIKASEAEIKKLRDKLEATTNEEEKKVYQETINSLEAGIDLIKKMKTVESIETAVQKWSEANGVEYESLFADFSGFSLSWAGAVLNDEVVGRSSIIAGISPDDFPILIKPIGRLIAEDYQKRGLSLQYRVFNDGDAAAILASMLDLEKVLALAFGSSTGGGYAE